MDTFGRTPHEDEARAPLRGARARRQFTTALYRLGPLPLGVVSALLISILALLYLDLVAQATKANHSIQQLTAQQSQLEQENQQLRQQQGILQSPGYIERRASQMGMVPADPSTVQVIVIPGLEPENGSYVIRADGWGVL